MKNVIYTSLALALIIGFGLPAHQAEAAKPKSKAVSKLKNKRAKAIKQVVKTAPAPQQLKAVEKSTPVESKPTASAPVISNPAIITELPKPVKPKRSIISEAYTQAPAERFEVDLKSNYTLGYTEQRDDVNGSSTTYWDTTRSGYFIDLGLGYGLTKGVALKVKTDFGQDKNQVTRSSYLNGAKVSETSTEEIYTGMGDVFIGPQFQIFTSQTARFFFEANYGISPASQTVPSYSSAPGVENRDGNRYSGGNSINSTLGFEARFHRMIVGLAGGYSYLQSRKADEVGNIENVTKDGEGNRSTGSLYTEYLFGVQNRIGLKGTYLQIASENISTYQNGSVVTETSIKPYTYGLLDAYASIGVGQNWVMLPSFTYRTLIEHEAINPQSKISQGDRWSFGLGTRFGL